MKVGTIIRGDRGPTGESVSLFVHRVRTEPGWVTVELNPTKQAPTHEVIPVGDSSTVCALARAILADPGNVVGWGVLLDAVGEAFNAFPDVERERERIRAAVEDGRGRPNEGMIIYTHGLAPLLAKLRDLGYGDAVDEYLRPAEVGMMSRPANQGELIPLMRTSSVLSFNPKYI